MCLRLRQQLAPCFPSASAEGPEAAEVDSRGGPGVEGLGQEAGHVRLGWLHPKSQKRARPSSHSGGCMSLLCTAKQAQTLVQNALRPSCARCEAPNTAASTKM